MAKDNRLTLLQRLFPARVNRSIVLQATLQNQISALERFSQVISNQIGVTALWNDGSYDGNVKGYATNGMLYSIVKRICDTAAIAPFKVYRVKDKKKHLRFKDHIHHWTGEGATITSIQNAMRLKNLVYEEDTVHPLNYLIENPNASQRGNEFTVNSVGFKCLTGNRFIYKNILDAGANAGNPFEVYNLPPQYMSVVSDGSLYGVAGYRFVLGRLEEIPVENIVHSKYFNPEFDRSGSHLLGLSPLRAANRNATRSDAAVERSTTYLQNAGSPGALVNEEGSDMSPEQAGQMMNDINKRIRGTNNAGKISALNGKWNYLNFGMTSGDMQVLETEKFTNVQLCNIFSVPPGLWFPEQATHNNSQEFKKELLTGAVIPHLSSLRDDWNAIAKSYRDNSIYVDYDLSVYPELQEDLEKSARIMSFAWWFNGNEKRLATGQDEDPNDPMMNEYLIPNNLIPLSQLGGNMQDLMNQIDGTAQGVGADPNQIVQ